MRIRFLFLLMMFGLMAQAQTIYVEGKQTGVWDADTVVVTGDVRVIDSLSIVRPGCVVLFDKFYCIFVTDGASFCVDGGSDTTQVTFTVADTTGFHLYDQRSGGWNGIRLEKAGKVLLNNCCLQYAKAADSFDPFGGALSIFGCEDVTITNSTLRCNFARESGGAVYAERSKLYFNECIISENKVYTADDIYAMYGGGACFKHCDVVMDWMIFAANYGPSCIGGGMSLDSCSLILDHADFQHNIAVNGGGMYLMRCNHKYCRMSNLLFTNNFSRHFGGGLAFADASPEVYNMTVTRNTSEGVTCEGIFFYQESAPKLTNCIIYGNYPKSEGPGLGDTIQMWLWTYNGFSPEFRNCLIENGLNSMIISDSLQVFEDIIDADPLFRYPEGYDFSLQPESPCIDAGNPIVPDFMTDGLALGAVPRVCNGRIDIGAFEYSANQVPETPVANNSALLFGNPLNQLSRVEFELVQSGPVSLQVYDMTGHRLVSQSLGRLHAGHQTVSLSTLAESLKPGLYFIEIRTPERNFVLKAIR